MILNRLSKWFGHRIGVGWIVAGRTSVDPSRISANTRTRGHGVLALTACGRRLGHRGAFDIENPVRAVG